ncbi:MULTISPECIES: DUF1788 domain-containing protein [Acinetobacter calcoaceticus/baumannii complex]|uniref:DUF1788 domain-containing protein n=1 Tax=Acinetobacter calcoaceticus/baumannii complex TaxID=909768 RepID=UPI001580BF78|nr:DUF1788 domain-containing protein [Acinetobacter lactucae]NUF37565.1 DUF1788 domain-containing protein [Acinetobacter lactucae]
MSLIIDDRLNQIQDKITSTEFLTGQGLGNEIGFWIFDYAPEDELKVREYIQFFEEMLAKKYSHLRVLHINLLQSLVDYLTERNFMDKAIQMQKAKGDDALLKALKGPLHMDKFAPYLVSKYATNEQDIVLISGIGSVWPLLRAHHLLNSLHSLLGHKPVLLFYPGYYDGQSMSLFGKIPSNNYYRAFKLVP